LQAGPARLECAIETVNLVKIYKGGVKALQGVSFCAKKGEIYGLLGPNGAGKTTTVKILSTLIKPTSGTARILGHDVVQESGTVRRLIGVVPQDLTSDDEMTGFENVYIHARLYGLGRKEAEEKAWEVLEFMGLTEAANRKTITYSGGMRKRLEIAMSLVHDPQVLFLDEPTLGLDVQSRRHLWDLILSLKKQGKTILLTTHYMEEADYLSDRVGIIDMGRIVAEGTPEELKRRLGGDRIHIRPVDPAQAQVIGQTLESAGFTVVLENGEVIVKVPKAEEALLSIARIIEKFNIADIRISKPNLEEVFLELTGRRLRDEESLDPFKYRIMSRRVRK